MNEGKISFRDKNYAVMRRGRGSTLYVTYSYYNGKEMLRKKMSPNRN
jgi:hypothetical protein